MNMRTVAKKAGVSSATVSRVISGSPLVKPETAKLVQKVIDELQFVPNTSATTLKYGRSNTYGLIVADLLNPFFAELIRQFEALLVNNDYELLIANTEFSEQRTTTSVRRMLLRRVEGVVLASEDRTNAFTPLIQKNVPIVTTDRRTVARGISDVGIRYETGMTEAIRHLASLGHRRIAFIGGSDSLISSKIRRKAFLQAMQNEGLKIYEELLAVGDFRVEGGDTAMRSLLALRERPTAVLAINDFSAFGAMKALHAYHLRVPDDVSVIGCDDVVLGSIMQPSLTTIRSSREDMARKCLGALLALREDHSLAGHQYWTDTTLVVRESIGRPPRKRTR